MAKTNIRAKDPLYTHEGARALRVTPELELRRSVLSTFLWEDQFYESGEDIATRISNLVKQVPASVAANIAVEARTTHNLRHAPLWILVSMIQCEYPNVEDRRLIGTTIPKVVLRADELSELLSLYWLNGRKPLTKQMKLGLSAAFENFNEYSLAKYNGGSSKVKLRDVMFLAHPKPADDNRESLYKRLASNSLETPYTWEVELSAGKDKKETFTNMLTERKLGYMAILRNLRNMREAGVDKSLVREALLDTSGAEKVLPFRFLSAAYAEPAWEDIVEDAFLQAAKSYHKIKGKTVIAVDVSGSMFAGKISSRSTMKRIDAASCLAAIAREMFEDVCIYATGSRTEIVPSRRGIALAHAVSGMTSVVGGGGIYLKQCLATIKEREKSADRIIVITDEQDCGGVNDSPLSADAFGTRNYLVNVASYKPAIGYGNKWTHIDTFSGSILEYIRESEDLQ